MPKVAIRSRYTNMIQLSVRVLSYDAVLFGVILLIVPSYNLLLVGTNISHGLVQCTYAHRIACHTSSTAGVELKGNF